MGGEEGMTEHYKGHASLADMVRTHIDEWREALAHMKVNPAYDKAYIDHELKALAEIENACNVDRDAAAVLYTMDQMRDYADAFHRSRVEAIAEPKRADLTGAMGAYLRVCSSGGMPAEQVKAVKVALEQAVDLGYFDSILAKGDK
jgi:hypothetical protein